RNLFSERLPSFAPPLHGRTQAATPPTGRAVSLEHGSGGPSASWQPTEPDEILPPVRAEFVARNPCGRICAGGWLVVAGARARSGAENSDAGGQGLQPHARAAAAASAALLHLHRSARRRDANGRHAALRRHD